MGFKDFFVERVPEEKLDEECNYDVEDETIPVELDSVNTDSLIEDVYTQNELLDKSKSIFKVEDLINSLPKEMVTETKRTSVLATLGVFGLTVTDVNLDGEKQQLGACSVGGVTLENTDKDNMVYQLPGKITVGESTLDDVLDAYGDPDDRYEEKDWVYVTYEYGIYKKADLVFDIEDEVLEKAVLKNYRDSEPEETSKDVPKEVSDYQAPEAFSENPLDFIVQFDGDFYQLPAPVSEFIKNGWKIDEEGSDTSVKAGRHGYVTLEKDGQTLYGVVNNYSKSAVPIKNSFLTNLHGDFDVTKVPIQIYRGITLGMNEESMKEALSDAKYETKEDEEGVSYYLYADEEKRDYVRIFVDKNLKLVREIELSNSPEGLEEKMLSEEDEKSVEASAMSGSDTLPEQE